MCLCDPVYPGCWQIIKSVFLPSLVSNFPGRSISVYITARCKYSQLSALTLALLEKGKIWEINQVL